MSAYRVHGPNVLVEAYLRMSDPAVVRQWYSEVGALEINGKLVFKFAEASLPAIQELIRSSDVSEVVRTFQGFRLVGVLMYRLTHPTQVLRVFPVRTGSMPEDHRQIVNEDRIYALIARCELQQPTMQEIDDILQELWDGTDAANWTDIEPAP